MLIKRINVKPMIVCPMGSILPQSIAAPVISEGTFLEKITANNNEQIAIVLLTTEELIALVEKPHLFGIDVIALVGVPGGRYDAVWSTYVAPLRRVSLETLDAEIQKIRQDAERPAGPKPRSIVERFDTQRRTDSAVTGFRANGDDDDASRQEGVLE